ncbi:hypothetical protein [Agromyces aerolatus]|uniref:hypothetical protein n=1 Tax=Agromyces sp. LY-1074 TaxID=3074080 RepID=UPI00286513EB|nr:MULTISPECIES: hypothetical protein [unclassified Agromyces]MDR5699625.1 hypothetical protein [Agromyces sp. LY-1074]MDR5705921.1 hypothetical protein [Agromyces sp. LY-1358]
MADYARYELETVRLVRDDGATEVWFPDPVEPEEAAFSAELAAALRDPHANPAALAARVGDELGSAFEVEYGSPRRRRFPWRRSRTARYRSSQPAMNPDASAAFEARAAAARARHAELADDAAWAATPDAAEMLGQGGVGGPFTFGNRTGEMFRPRPRRRR